MSYELYNGDKYLGSLATIKGMDDLTAYANSTSYSALTSFCNDGESDDLDNLRRDVDAALNTATAPSSVRSTLKGLKEMLSKATDTVTIVS